MRAGDFACDAGLLPFGHGRRLPAGCRLPARQGARHRQRQSALRARTESHAGLLFTRSARRAAASALGARGGLVQHWRRRGSGRGRHRHHLRQGQALRQDRRRDGFSRSGGTGGPACLARPSSCRGAGRAGERGREHAAVHHRLHARSYRIAACGAAAWRAGSGGRPSRRRIT